MHQPVNPVNLRHYVRELPGSCVKMSVMKPPAIFYVEPILPEKQSTTGKPI